MKKKKVLKISLGVIGALLPLIICTILFWLGPTIQLVVEQIGPKALGTDVKIEKLSINPRKGIIHLSGFTIANPEHYSSSNSVSLASLDIAVDMASLFAKTVTVHEVAINSPHFVFEQSSASDNIAEYIQSIENFIGYDPSVPVDPKKEEKKRKKKEKSAKKRAEKEPVIVIVESLQVNDIQLLLNNSDDPDLDISVGLDSLTVSMTNGVVAVDNLYVNNPKRLSSKDLISLDKIFIKVDPATIYKAPLKIDDVQIIDPHFYVEWAYDASTVSEFLYIADATYQRIQEWPLPKKTETSKTNLVEVADMPKKAPPPPPDIYTVSVTNFQFHLVNSVYHTRTITASLDLLSADLSSGTIDFSKFAISNPTRLETENLFTLDGISIKLDPDSIYTKTVVFDDITIRTPYLFLESNPKTDTVEELMKIAETATSSIPTNTLTTASAKTNITEEATTVDMAKSDPEVTPPIELHNLLVDDIQVLYLNTTTNSVSTEQRMLAGIGSITVKLVDGKIHVSEVTIPNMPGFHKTNLFHLANIDVSIDPETLFKEQMIINKVFIDSPTANMEQTEKSGNVAALQKSLMELAPEPGDSEDAPKVSSVPQEIPAEPMPQTEPVILQELQVTNLAINLTLPPDTNAPTHKAISYLNPMSYMKAGKADPKAAQATNVVTEVEDRNLHLLGFQSLTFTPPDGMLTIDHLRVSNPPGFSKKDLMRIQQFRVDIDENSLQTDTVIIEDTLILKPDIRYERQIRSDNLKALELTIHQAAVHRQEAMDDEAQAPIKEPKEELPIPEGTNMVASATQAESSPEGQKVVINKLLIKGGIVRAKLSALPSIPVPLMDIEMVDVGKKEGGASVEDATQSVLDTLYEHIINAVGSTTGVATDSLKSAGSMTMGAVEGLWDGAGNLLGKASDGVGNAVTGTKDAIEETVEKVKKKRTIRRAGRRSPTQ
jgi:hypothetical protein